MRQNCSCGKWERKLPTHILVLSCSPDSSFGMRRYEFVRAFPSNVQQPAEAR